ncbi:hypothetical protein BDE02_01G305200 [Populus trichocarpa]|nr:hypothetical protein BDE02_01G305200 [Populus trichocarpa]
MHVSIMVLGYATLLCGSLLSTSLLVITFQKVIRIVDSYWNWDPKETWAFITWTIFAIYFHTRTNKNLEGLHSYDHLN